eukprot:COSAG05_NODE_467_length_9529_cov_27.560976_12_plen_93_part_00
MPCFLQLRDNRDRLQLLLHRPPTNASADGHNADRLQSNRNFNAYHLQSSGAKILTTVRKANVVTKLAAFIDAPAIEAAVYTPSTATRDTTDT